MSSLQLPSAPKNYSHAYQSYVCLYTENHPAENLTMVDIQKLHEKRNRFMEKLSELGIQTRPGAQALHNLLYYREHYNYQPENYLNAYIADKLSIALPIYPDMTIEETQYVIDHIKQLS